MARVTFLLQGGRRTVVSYLANVEEIPQIGAIIVPENHPRYKVTEVEHQFIEVRTEEGHPDLLGAERVFVTATRF